MNKFRKIMVAVVAMALLVMGGTAVFAQQADGGNAAPSAQGNDQQRRPPHAQNGRFTDPAAVTEATADILGISVEELQAAREEATALVRAEAIAQAVADGQMTQEEADAILERIELGNVMRDIFNRESITAAVADALGMSVEEVEAAHENGIGLPQLAEEAGIEMSVVVESLEQAKADALQAAVDSGLITQEQADEINSRPLRRPHGNNGNRPPNGRPGGRPSNGAPNGAPQGNFNTAPNGFNG